MSEGEVTERSDPGRFADGLAAAVKVAEAEDVPYAVFGSIASAHWGRPAPSGDIDLFVRAHDARSVHEAFEREGWETREENPKWLLKATKDGVLVDLIFKVRGDIYFDDEMREHAVGASYLGVDLTMLSPEDTLLVEALSNEYETPDHWFNALAILATQEDLDWDYLMRRARMGARRILSLLIYAQSTDVTLPTRHVRDLYRIVYEQEA
ncbi:MAG: nucleotidyltransferase [Actinomycetota bacterium]